MASNVDNLLKGLRELFVLTLSIMGLLILAAAPLLVISLVAVAITGKWQSSKKPEQIAAESQQAYNNSIIECVCHSLKSQAETAFEDVGYLPPPYAGLVGLCNLATKEAAKLYPDAGVEGKSFTPSLRSLPCYDDVERYRRMARGMEK